MINKAQFLQILYLLQQKGAFSQAQTVRNGIVLIHQIHLYFAVCRLQLLLMGSNPSAESQENNQKHSDHSRHQEPPNVKESLKLLKNRLRQHRQEINPEKESVDMQEEPPVDAPKETPRRKDVRPRDPPPKSSPLDLEALAKSNIPKNALSSDAPEEEEQNSQQNQRTREKREQHRPTGRERVKHSYEEQQEGKVHERTKMRHPPTHHDQEDYLHNSSIMNKGQPGKEEVDYRQFDSSHIRHKALREVHQQEHPIRPIRQQEPVYEHEQLYPKILKNYHHDPEGVRSHRPHEDPQEHNKINVFKRHRPTHQEEREVEEQPIPSSHPNFKIHKVEKDLQRSMEVRERHEEEQYVPRTHRQAPNRQNVPQNADFRKRKQSTPAEEESQNKDAKNRVREIEEKSIAELNKENQLGVTEYEVDPSQLVTCREGCGRKFHSGRIKKHEAICREVFQQKRQAFNAQEKRIVSKEQQKLMKRGLAEQKKHSKEEGEGEIPKWKAMSIALRAHIKMGTDEDYRPTREEAEMLSQEQHIDVVNCQFCGRNFNKNAAKSHIPFCKGQYEKSIDRERVKKPIKARH